MKITATMFLCAMVFTSIAQAKEPEMDRCFHLNETMEKEYGYCGAVASGGFLYVSGTVGSGEIRSAIKQAYDNIQLLLEQHGLNFSDVVRETVFTTNLDGFTENRDLRKSYYKGVYPSASWLQVEKLYGGKYTVEIEVTATLGE